MDNFREEVVVRHQRGLYTMLYMLSWVMLIISGLIAMVGLMGVMRFFSAPGEGFDFVSLILLVAFGGAGFLLWRNKDELRAEYEYAFTNGDLDISKVLNNSRRKYLTSLPMKSVEACGPVTHQSFQRYLTMKDVKKHNWFLNREAKLYFFYFVKGGVKHLVVAELSDEMVGLIRSHNYLNFSVWQG